jgi:CBS domain containing-hemolysin-like protein
MVPAAKVQACTRDTTIESVLDTMIANQISAIVVTGDYGDPVGLVTTSTLIKCYRDRIPLENAISDIMMEVGDTLLDTDSRDTAARMLEQCGRHHAVVVNSQGHFVGLVSTFDVVSEVAKDARAWPWMRTDDGKVHPHKEQNAPATKIAH